MRVLVTGSAGFLGQHVARHLGDQGHRVVGFDLLPSPTVPDYFVGDLTESSAVADAVRGCEAVVHLGGIGDVDLATSRPDLAVAANAAGSAIVGATAQAAGLRVVYASTWEVYGPTGDAMIDEDHDCAPEHVYAVSKLLGERALRSLQRHGGLSLHVLRLGTAYGPGLRPNAVMPRFATAARDIGTITVQGDGSQWRQFTHTSDIARAFELALKSSREHLVANIVTDEVTTIAELAGLVAERWSAGIEFGAARPGDPPSVTVDSARAAEALGWRATTRFRVGLAAFLDEFERTVA